MPASPRTDTLLAKAEPIRDDGSISRMRELRRGKKGYCSQEKGVRIHQSGTAWELDEAMAAQCGYTVTYTTWRSIEFRASALSCHSHLKGDVFTVTIQIKASHTPDMSDAATHLKTASCHYGPWSPRELICESNYMEDQGITFSVLRSSTFYKYQWVILMLDTAVACPIDGVDYTNKTITWTVPKYIPPLSAGVTSFKDVLVEAGVDLHKLSAKEMASRKYVLLNEQKAITMKIPIGAEGGYYKTSVSNGQLGLKYTINLFLEHQWEDNKWRLTKHTIIKEIETPFEQTEVAITNNLNLSARLMNVTVGTFLPDVELVNLTIEGVAVAVPEAVQHGYLIHRTRYANGSKAYVVEVPLDAPSVKKEYMREDMRAYTLNVTLTFVTNPSSETFVIPVIVLSAVKDAECLPNGTVIITAIKLVGGEDLDTALLVLRDRQCKPSLVTEKTATFKFSVNTCGTSRKFNSTTMTYENEVLYFRPGNDTPVYQLKFLCSYAVKQTADVRYESKKNPPPSIKPGFGCLALSLKLFKEKSYSEPYQESEYPVVKYLREALYFEVELLQPKDARLDLNLDDCWATNSQSQDILPQWHILIHGCENNKDSYRTVFHKVNYSLRVKFPQHFKRFEVRMFTFVQDPSLLQEQVNAPTSDRLNKNDFVLQK
ncbi:hypothetical protein DUI87_05787 [Hirundo rustica rustica]|uniref:ZP domain-containing protein n=1 Tax=Hirundo rustica rustica TaxID=333673 RepID=A0A3M0L2G4_HIRRU|nr:hypothetical protein DUI87_05787 [Hirundo rustica rustica]